MYIRSCHTSVGIIYLALYHDQVSKQKVFFYNEKKNFHSKGGDILYKTSWILVKNNPTDKKKPNPFNIIRSWN